MSDTPISLFSDLNLSEPLIRALKDVGYETPSPIQAATIPLLLANRDVLGQAQTGTGKTAAFALPILSRIDLKQSSPQALVLAPTRELAIQVAEAFQVYAAHIPGFHVLPIYGGQSYGPQLSALRRGVHVIVGTPGRVIDHLDKGSLDLSKLKTLVLDEADEMLRMGFIDDVERILKETPEGHQTALFSATMPSVIKRIATTYLVNPAEVTVAAKTGTADNIRQRYWLVSGMHKLDALTRILEAEAFDGMIIFARTKLGTEELAGKLQARGFSAAAINGDIQQAQRERTIQQLKDGKIDILVATDVAARGLDVERISHVVNYDVPHDPESYTHRIGRTGRAGRSGEAILFITPREKNLLKAIERSTRQPIGMLELPTIQAVNDVRIAKFKEQISETLALGELEQFQSLIEDFEREQNIPAIEIAAALAKMARGNTPLLLDKNKAREQATWQDDRPVRQDRFERNDRPERGDRFDRNERSDRGERPAFPKKERIQRPADAGMQTFRIEVGHQHGVKPGNIVGAIANEAGIDSKNIGRIEIYDDYSVLDLPDSMPKELLDQLKTVWVAGQQLRISRDGDAPDLAPPAAPRKPFAAKSAPAFKDAPADAGDAAPAPRAPKKERPRPGVTAYRIEVGREHAVTPSNIVGAIANEANLEAKHIGRIDIFDNYSVLDLPEGMPPEILDHLKSVVVSGQKLRISLDDGTTERKPAPPRPKSPRKTFK
ncbi:MULTISPECIES: DEAD/DEAH box helicase [Janthinobacterium]|uniref:DEAD/DEAH box helicase n=1 Tax=Janthinobacterium TaxID=29580 RepID=UPI0006350B5C|nr:MULTISPECIES: DEAD/DEAH box helicase [unclassified Janthinobacterium]KKO65663.1 ATP-dependent RNA helicase DeaD [Janthinobacterium sp. KBS0711]NVI85220.1 DEAD/DEAH box helicase [Janthinobacterium sp. BJB401]PHV34415.1 RNA helicase [Janthinobacterium sp. BJB312]TSD70310.1 DEAD/DEAH box helicase [Janthinobacterium sp. KBS0711]